MVSNTRLYGAAIAFASGGYSLWSSATASRMVASAWLMLLLGLVVIGHGVVLLSDAADRLGDASGPLMIAYSLVMLVNQTLLAAGVLDDGSGMMNGGMAGGTDGGMGGSGVTAAMGWDLGMVALAALMLVSGLIMTRKESMDGM